MYELNICTPLYDSTQDGQTNLRATRILLAVDLLLLCLAYNLISFVLKKSINDLKLEDKQSNQMPIQQLEHAYKKWQQEYLLSLGDHVVALGFVMCFSPYELEIVLAMGFVAARTVFQIRLHKWGKTTKQLKTVMRIINMGLLLCAMVGLSRTEYNDVTSICDDSTYRF